MTRTPTLLVLAAIAAVASPLLSQSAQAVAVTGTIGFNGNATGSQVGGASGTSTITFHGPMAVDLRTGDYSGIPVGTTTTFAPISWTGSGTSAVLTSTNTPEWTINFGGTTYQYSIVRLYSAVVGTFMGTEAFNVYGDGIATISGAFNREPTYLTFSLQGLGGDTFFTILPDTCIPGQCSGGPRLVPEGGSPLTLLVMGFAALAVLSPRWRTTRAQKA